MRCENFFFFSGKEKKKTMKLVIKRKLNYDLRTIECALLLLRKEQAEPGVTFTQRKNEETHKVFQIDYDVPFLITPFVGSTVVLREDFLWKMNCLIVTTQSEGYSTKTYPYMFTQSVFTPDENNKTATMTTTVEWAIRKGGVPLMEERLEAFGKTRFEEILKLQNDYCEKIVNS